MENLKGYIKFDRLIMPQITVAATPIASEVAYSMAGYAKGMVLILANLQNGQSVVAQLRCYTSAALASGADVTSFTKTLTGAGGVISYVGGIDFDAMDLTGIAATKYFVGVTLTPSHNGDWVAAVLLRGDARDYAPDSSGFLA